MSQVSKLCSVMVHRVTRHRQRISDWLDNLLRRQLTRRQSFVYWTIRDKTLRKTGSIIGLLIIDCVFTEILFATQQKRQWKKNKKNIRIFNINFKYSLLQAIIYSIGEWTQTTVGYKHRFRSSKFRPRYKEIYYRFAKSLLAHSRRAT